MVTNCDSVIMVLGGTMHDGIVGKISEALLTEDGQRLCEATKALYADTMHILAHSRPAHP